MPSDILKWETKPTLFDTNCVGCGSHIAKGDQIAILHLPHKTSYVFGPCCDDRTDPFVRGIPAPKGMDFVVVTRPRWKLVVSAGIKGIDDGMLDKMWESFRTLYAPDSDITPEHLRAYAEQAIERVKNMVPKP